MQKPCVFPKRRQEGSWDWGSEDFEKTVIFTSGLKTSSASPSDRPSDAPLFVDNWQRQGRAEVELVAETEASSTALQ